VAIGAKKIYGTSCNGCKKFKIDIEPSPNILNIFLKEAEHFERTPGSFCIEHFAASIPAIELYI